MTNLQLALSIGIPSLLVLVGIFLNNSRFGVVESRIDRMGSELNARIDRLGSDLNARLDRQQADLSQFYQTLGRHDADIANLKDARRSA